ncbi:Hypothetical protein PHPALM_18172 [Phytophthora palmivora]|uniref:Uncharacterized protein n=1 Tax=Phytophthora palmivora TaxID=4796 RepID=A0A2P4XKJ6_9STRA|nr:Hypothetical protein PHPALM_18172 [Phytophthora palmivora]
MYADGNCLRYTADADSTSIGENAPASEGYADGDDRDYAHNDVASFENNDSASDESCDGDRVAAPDDTGDEDYELEDDLDDSEEEEKTTGSPARAADRRQHHSVSSRQTRLEVMDALDSNLVLDGGNAFLESDGEGRDESDEDSDNDDASDTESSYNELPQVAGLQNEVAHLTSLLDSDELKRLHMNVQASSQVFADAQLEDMTDRGWYRLPENATVDIPNDRDVDRMYKGYCGPSEDVIGASKSPIDLFYYFLPKPLWRQIASY